MFLHDEHGHEQGGGAVALPHAMPAGALVRVDTSLAGRLKRRFPDFEFIPDLGARIGSLTWFRGAASCLGLCAVTVLLAPGLERPVYGRVAAPMQGKEWQAAQAQMIAPLGQGAHTGYRLAATDLVTRLTDTPERPTLNLPVSIGSGEALASLLRRSGVGEGDASKVVGLVQRAVSLDDIKSTEGDLILGRRPDKSQPRPLENFGFRARFDLKLQIVRRGGELVLNEIPVAIDHTPLRVQGVVGSGGLYRAARASGMPAKAVEEAIKALATRVPMGQLANVKFDLVAERARAETGEVQFGKLLYASVVKGATKVQLVRWDDDGHTEWYDALGRGERKGVMQMPTNGRISSSFGMRRHPILGYTRMHKGIDIATPYGSPVYAATDGVVQFAGRSSGYGNFVKLAHPGNFGTGYGHLSRILVRPGQHVRRGQLIAASGNSGLSTGPHLHYETYRGGVAVNPMSIAFSVVRQLTGGDLGEFRSRLGRILATPVSTGKSDDEE